MKSIFAVMLMVVGAALAPSLAIAQTATPIDTYYEVRGADANGCGGWIYQVTVFVLPNGGGSYSQARIVGPNLVECDGRVE